MRGYLAAGLDHTSVFQAAPAMLILLGCLEPGDIIATGTPAGGRVQTLLKAGDVVEIEIPGVGTTRNPVVAAA